MKKISKISLLLVGIFTLLTGVFFLTTPAGGGGILEPDDSQEEIVDCPNLDNSMAADWTWKFTARAYYFDTNAPTGALSTDKATVKTQYKGFLGAWYNGESVNQSTSWITGSNDSEVRAIASAASGYTFVGWYADASCRSNLILSTSDTLSRNISGTTDDWYYAKCSQSKVWYLNIVTNGSSAMTGGTINNITYKSGSTTKSTSIDHTYASFSTYYAEQVSFTVAANVGYTYNGVRTGASVSSAAITYGNNFYTGEGSSGASSSYYVHFLPNTYTISCNLNGGSYSGTLPTKGTYDSAFYLANPTRVGYTFAGWTFNGNTSYAKYGSSSSSCTTSWSSTSTKTTATYFKNLTTTNNGSVTLTANWTPITYNISYALNSGSYGTYHPTSATYDTAFQLSNPTRSGFTFAGWTFNGNTSYAKYGTSSSACTTSWSSTSTKVTSTYFKNLVTSGLVTLTANWTDATAPVISRTTWVQNGSTGYYVYAYVTDNVGVNRVQFPTWTDASGQDDIQSNWQTDSGSSGTSGSWTVNSQTYNYRYTVNVSSHNNEYGMYHTHIYAYDAAGNSSATAINDITFKFTVTLNSNGGSGGTTSVTATYGSAMPSIPSIPSKSGWTFLGYYDSQTSGTQYYTSTGTSAHVWDKAANTTLYAHWQEKTWLEGYYATSYGGGDGTQSNPYIISTAAHLARLAYATNNNLQTTSGLYDGEAYYKQTTDIDISAHLWQPVGNEKIPFVGVYNGDLYKIKNIRSANLGCVGLFGCLESNAQVRCIYLEGGNITASGYAGGIVGLSRGAVSRVARCIVDSVEISGTQHAGGIAGISEGRILQCQVKNCRIIGDFAGGIAAIGGNAVSNTNVISTEVNGGAQANILCCEPATTTSNWYGIYGEGIVNVETTKMMYTGSYGWQMYSIVQGINNDLPVQKGLYYIGGFTDAEEVRSYLEGLGFVEMTW